MPRACAATRATGRADSPVAPQEGTSREEATWRLYHRLGDRWSLLTRRDQPIANCKCAFRHMLTHLAMSRDARQRRGSSGRLPPGIADKRHYVNLCVLLQVQPRVIHYYYPRRRSTDREHARAGARGVVSQLSRRRVTEPDAFEDPSHLNAAALTGLLAMPTYAKLALNTDDSETRRFLQRVAETVTNGYYPTGGHDPLRHHLAAGAPASPRPARVRWRR